MQEAIFFAQAIVVRLFRTWSAAKTSGEPSHPHVVAAAQRFGQGEILAAAAASLFDLVEGHLGRRLEPECCCSRKISADERALLGVLRHASGGAGSTSTPAVPHGLPAAICWAALVVRRDLGLDDTHIEEPALGASRSCPFESSQKSASRVSHAA
jgi:hypothetical protein